MQRLVFDGFSIVLPPGWSDVLEDETYSNPDQLPPVAFAADRGVGKLFVSIPALHADEEPGVSPDDALEWALAWGQRRGVLAVDQARDSSPRGGLGYAAYELAGSFVAVWFLFGGDAILHVTYVCPVASEAVEREAREAIVGSLAFSR